MLIDIVFQPCCIQVRACTPRRHARASAELSRAEILLRQLPKRRALLKGCAKIKIESKSQIADLAAARGAAGRWRPQASSLPALRIIVFGKELKKNFYQRTLICAEVFFLHILT